MAKLFANHGDPDQMPHSAASDLGLHCLPITLLRFPRLQWVNLYHSGQIQQLTNLRYFFCFSQKIVFGISSKLSLRKTVCMKCPTLFPWKNKKKKKKKFKLSSAEFLPSMPSAKE